MTVLDFDVVTRCSDCNEPLNESDQCLNIECSKAIASATRTASRDTAKTSVAAAAGALAEPRAFTSTGRVD